MGFVRTCATVFWMKGGCWGYFDYRDWRQTTSLPISDAAPEPHRELHLQQHFSSMNNYTNTTQSNWVSMINVDLRSGLCCRPPTEAAHTHEGEPHLHPHNSHWAVDTQRTDWTSQQLDQVILCFLLINPQQIHPHYHTTVQMGFHMCVCRALCVS